MFNGLHFRGLQAANIKANNRVFIRDFYGAIVVLSLTGIVEGNGEGAVNNQPQPVFSLHREKQS